MERAGYPCPVCGGSVMGQEFYDREAGGRGWELVCVQCGRSGIPKAAPRIWGGRPLTSGRSYGRDPRGYEGKRL